MTFTLVMVPGRGAEGLTMDDNSTVADLVTNKSLHGRSIYIDGEAIVPERYGSTCIPHGSEVFATGTIKGNK